MDVRKELEILAENDSGVIMEVVLFVNRDELSAPGTKMELSKGQVYIREGNCTVVTFDNVSREEFIGETWRLIRPNFVQRAW